MRLNLLTAAIAAASALGSRLCSMAGLAPRPRLKRTPKLSPIEAHHASAPRIAAPRASRGWWNDPQSEASIQWHKDRAIIRRARRFHSDNASNYAMREFRKEGANLQPEKLSRLPLAACIAAGIGLLTSGCEVMKSARVSLEPGAGICVTSQDGKYAVCVNPLTKPISYTLKAGAKGYAMEWHSQTGTYRATLPDGSAAIYNGQRLSFEAPLPTSGKDSISSR